MEIELRSQLHQLGLRFRTHQRVLDGLRRTADILFSGSRVAVFVDGCFWHGCPKHGTLPKTHRKWWAEKIAANRRRDKDTDDRLKALGWKPMRVWEHEDGQAAAQRIASLVTRRRIRGVL